MASGGRPNTSSSSVSVNTSDYYGYMGLGGMVIIVNVTAFAVLLCNRILLRRSALIVGITLGNLLLGMELFVSGLYRTVYTVMPQRQPAFTDCLLTIFPILYAPAYNTSAIFLILGGLERLLATTRANWFRHKWTTKTSWSLMAAAIVFVIATTVAGLVSGTYSRILPLSWNCSIPSVYSAAFLAFLTGFSASGGAFCALFTIVALGAGIKRIRNVSTASNDAIRLRKQLQLTKSMATVSCIDFVLVALPNFISFLTSMGVTFPSFVRPWNNNYTQAANALVAFFAFLAFNHKFRKVFIKVFCLSKVVEKLKGTRWPWKRNQVTSMPPGETGNVATMAARASQNRPPAISITSCHPGAQSSTV